MSRWIRVGLVDDHPMVVGGIEAALAATPGIEVVARAGTIADASPLLDRPDIAVVLLDVRLPDGNGMELLARTMRSRRPAVIVLSSYQARQYVAAAIRFGAQGFQLKTAPIEELVGAIRTVAAGGTAFDPDQLGDGGFVALTPRERDLLRQVVAERSGEGIAVESAAGGATRKTRLSRLFERFGVTSRAELATRAEHEGWLDGSAGGVVARHGPPAA
jgi:DNA-binding NarL/FixJ family response regulator